MTETKLWICNRCGTPCILTAASVEKEMNADQCPFSEVLANPEWELRR